MAISLENSQQTTLNVTGEGSEAEIAVSVTCYLKPGQTFNLSMDMRNAAIVAENMESVTAAIGAYLRQEMAKAAATGLPAPTVLPAGE